MRLVLSALLLGAAGIACARDTERERPPADTPADTVRPPAPTERDSALERRERERIGGEPRRPARRPDDSARAGTPPGGGHD